MELIMNLMGDYSGVLSLVVILLSALAIPAGVIWALVHCYKGPVELAHEPKPEPEAEKAHHSAWRDQRYVH